MSTNYYVAENPCEHCGRADNPYHIGKSGTIIRAYKEMFPGDDPPTPWGEVTSWSDWRAIIQLADVVITDEYGATHTPQEFIEIFEARSPEDRRRQFDLVQRDYPAHSKRYTLDADGFSVCDYEFS